jgi:hypothetical protein
MPKYGPDFVMLILGMRLGKTSMVFCDVNRKSSHPKTIKVEISVKISAKNFIICV